MKVFKPMQVGNYTQPAPWKPGFTQAQKRNALRWLDALTNGLWMQGTSQLRKDSNGCCCLGVGLDIGDPKGWDYQPSKQAYSHRHAKDLLPMPDESWFYREFGITDLLQEELARRNDRGDTFKEIATRLERYYFEEPGAGRT